MEIPYQQIPAQTLRKMIESFVMREGTDYGPHEYSLQQKVDQVLRQLKSGKVKITFNPEDETFDLQSTTSPFKSKR